MNACFIMSSDGDFSIIADNLTKVYPGKVGAKGKGDPPKPAVDGVSFRVKRGEIFGLLGPNGAGKTTTIKMLSTLLIPTSGTATVLGQDVEESFMDIRRRINLISGGERGLYYRVSGRQNLRFFSDLYRIPHNLREKRIDELLKTVGLEKAGDKKVEDYSRGMKQRLHIARGLVNDPEVLFMDEPTMGLDPEIAMEIRSLIKDMSKQGKTMLLTTHYMYEAEELCDHVNIIVQGKIVARGTVADLKEAVRDKLVLEVEANELSEKAIKAIRAIDGVQDVTVKVEPYHSVARVRTTRDNNLIPIIASKLGDCQVTRISNEEPTLEDVYMSMVTRNG